MGSRRTARSTPTGAASAAARPPSAPLTPPSTPPRTKKRKIVVEDDNVYIVERILARSERRRTGLDGVLDYWFLVRWEGYGPKDDTWESHTNLLDGAAQLVREFEARDHPFTILAVRGMNPPTFHVYYGAENAPSPYYQDFWHSRAEMKQRGDILPDTVDQAIRAFQSGRSTAFPTPISRSPSRSLRSLSARTASRESPGRKTRQRGSSPSHAESEGGIESDRSHETKLLAIVDRSRELRKRPSKSKQYRYSYKVRYRFGSKVREEWIGYYQGITRFHKHVFSQHLREYMEKPVISFTGMSEIASGRAWAESQAVTELKQSEYEKERLKNIQANKEMMMSLGLSI